MAQAVPVNLITSIQSVGFDFHMTPREVGNELIAGTQMLWKKEVTLGASVSNSGSGPVLLAPAASFGATAAPTTVAPTNAVPRAAVPSRRPRLADPVK
jgi:hypothetical protein